MRLERKMIIDVEGGTHSDCMRILRHEAGWQVHREPDGTSWWISPTGRRYPKPPNRHEAEVELSEHRQMTDASNDPDPPPF